AARAVAPQLETFASIEELGKTAALDFVDICTPPALHAELILAALRTGWNVLCEKPLVLDPADIERIRGAASESGRAVVPVHNWKYAPIIRRATEALRSGRIGRLEHVEIETLRFEDCAAVDPANPSWRRDPAIAGGGILFDHGWHAIYLARHWFDQEPTDLTATLHNVPQAGVEDEATLILNFGNGDARIFLTWRATGRATRMRLLGERGEIAINDDTLIIEDDLFRFGALSAGSHHPDWFEAMLPDVTASFRSREISRGIFEEAALCLLTIRRAYQVANVV
ncbi:MAG: Gfo/Idh/MocA family protein, partial [Chthoniobacterales bacterium]